MSCILRSEPTSGGNRLLVYTKVGPETIGITKRDFLHFYVTIQYQRRNINLLSLFQYLPLPSYMEFHALKYGRFSRWRPGSAGLLCQRLYSPNPPSHQGRREGRGGALGERRCGSAYLSGLVQPLADKSRFLGSREQKLTPNTKTYFHISG